MFNSHFVVIPINCYLWYFIKLCAVDTIHVEMSIVATKTVTSFIDHLFRNFKIIRFASHFWDTIIVYQRYVNEWLYTGLFSFRVFFALLHLQNGLPRLKFYKTKLCLKKDNIIINSSSLIFARWQWGRKGLK